MVPAGAYGAHQCIGEGEGVSPRGADRRLLSQRRIAAAQVPASAVTAKDDHQPNLAIIGESELPRCPTRTMPQRLAMTGPRPPCRLGG
jgi:hypothetical protein